MVDIGISAVMIGQFIYLTGRFLVMQLWISLGSDSAAANSELIN